MLALSYPNEASLCATALTWTPNTAEQLFKRSGRDYARSSKKSRNSRGALERKSTGSANWKSSHHQSFPVLSAGTNFGVEPCDRRPSNGTLTRGGESFAQPLQGCLRESSSYWNGYRKIRVPKSAMKSDAS